jgi:hypothetical protein
MICKDNGENSFKADFSPDYKSDTTAMVVNKAAVDAMNLLDPIGQKIDMWEKNGRSLV